MLVQPQQAATVCEFDLVPHVIGSLERAQTLDPNPRPESSHEPLNLTLDLEYAHVRIAVGARPAAHRPGPSGSRWHGPPPGRVPGTAPRCPGSSADSADTSRRPAGS